MQNLSLLLTWYQTELLLTPQWSLIRSTRHSRNKPHRLGLAAHHATLSTVSECGIVPNHVIRIVLALPCRCPICTMLIVVGALLGRAWFLQIVIGADMNPFWCWPFFTFNDRAATMETGWICCAIDVKAKEEHCIALFRLHCKQRKRQTIDFN